MPRAPRDTPRAHAPPKYLAPYLDALDEHGATFGATLWNSREWQQRRFEVLASLAHFHGRTILDCGCGLGDLAQYLADQKQDYARYIGLEALPEIQAAAARRNLPRAEFHATDFVAELAAFSQCAHADAIIFCGSLNTLDDATVYEVLERAWDSLTTTSPERKRRDSNPSLSRAPDAPAPTLLFNFLSDAREKLSANTDDAGPARRLNTRRLLDWALTKTPAVAFRSDYLPGGHDATIAMRR